MNPYLIKMLGYSREEFEKKLWEVGAFKDIKASQEAFEALQKNEYIRYDDLPLKTKDGKPDSGGIRQQRLSWWVTKKSSNAISATSPSASGLRKNW